MKNKKIIKLLTTGGIVISITPSFCNGSICEPSHHPDLPTEGFSYDYNLQSSAYISSISGTITTLSG